MRKTLPLKSWDVSDSCDFSRLKSFLLHLFYQLAYARMVSIRQQIKHASLRV